MILYRPIVCLLFCTLLLSGLSAQKTGEEKKETVGSGGSISTMQALSVSADSSGLTVPNVFTPNGDGTNDYIEVATDGSTLYKFSVFTRTGTRIFFSESPRIFWDGKNSAGKDMPAGIYYYVIEEKEGAQPFEAAGFVHLFR